MDNNDFQFDLFSDRCVYTLPKRKLPETRLFGWSAIVVGVLGSIGVIVSMLMTIIPGVQAVQQKNPDGWVNIALGLSGILWLAATVAIFMGGIAVTFHQTYCTIDLKLNKLIARERFWFISWKRAFPCDTITSLTISIDNGETQDDSAGENDTTLISLNLIQWLGQWRSNLIAGTDAGEFAIALAYPRELLLELAHHLAPRLDAQTTMSIATIDRNRVASPRRLVGRIEIVDESLLVPASDSGPPRGSKLLIERRDDGVTITVPRQSGWRTMRLPILFFTIFITLASVKFRPRGGIIPLKLFMVFAIGGAFVAALVWEFSRRVTTISTHGESLRIRTRSWLHRSTKQWSRGSIYEIKTALKSIIDHTADPYELQIHAVGEEPYRCLQQLNQKELEWIASELSQSLAISPNRIPEEFCRDQLGRPLPPPKSRLSIEYDDAAASVRIPPVSIARRVGLPIISIMMLHQTIMVVVFLLVPKANLTLLMILVSVLMIASVLGTLAWSIWTRKTCNLSASQDQLRIEIKGRPREPATVLDRQEIQPLRVTQTFHKLSPSDARHQILIRKKNAAGTKEEKILFQHKLLKGRDRDDLTFLAAAINETMDLVPGTNEDS